MTLPSRPSRVLLVFADNLVLPKAIPHIAAAVSPKNKQFKAYKHSLVSKYLKLNPRPRKKPVIPVLAFSSEGRIRDPNNLQYMLLNALIFNLIVSKMKITPDRMIKIAPAFFAALSGRRPIRTLAIEPHKWNDFLVISYANLFARFSGRILTKIRAKRFS